MPKDSGPGRSPTSSTGHGPPAAGEETRRAGNDRKTIPKQGGWVGGMEGYFEDADGWGRTP
ncbi:hypothetical protein Scani_37890 [Streptomyces caniferus]|uniref:Uncharacterized protein n=1 Tax=Streptomyces caniferus TaxID=285557 RepID=A0A640SAN7_9ACTN|nr:hypothetical protein Scani_37890 [Streptomyces caniferus]